MRNGLIALLCAYFIGGAIAPIFVKLGTREFPAFLFSELRFLVAIAVILPFFLRQKRDKIVKKDRKLLAFNSLLFFGNVALFSFGIQYTTAITSQILYALLPLLVAVFAHFLLSERVTRNKIIGLFVALLGVGLLISQSISTHDTFSFGKPIGNILVLGAVVSWSLYAVISKKLHVYSPITISMFNFAIMAAALLFLIPIELMFRDFSFGQVTSMGILSVIVVGIGVSAIMIFLLQYALRQVSAITVSIFAYLGPLFAAVTAIPVLHEKITTHLIIGGVLIIAGVFYATTYELLRKKR